MKTDPGPGRHLRFAPAALWAGLIWLSSSVDWAALGWGLGGGGGLLPDWLPADKVVHLSLYALLAWLIRRPMRLGGWGALSLAALLATAWGACDELHQGGVPGRSADVFDLLADGLGAALGAWAAGWRPDRRA